MSHRLAPRFIAGAAGRLHLTEWVPTNPLPSQPIVLLVPAFAEEMNRSRRMFAEQARSLAARGIGAATFDAFGTGDSEGEFAQASWDGWLDDLQAVVDHLRAPAATRPLGMIALRSGALLALDTFARRPGQFAQAVLWAPILEGRSIVRQLVRLHAAMFMNAERMDSDKRPLEERLAAGESLEISGYMITGSLVAALKARELRLLASAQPPPIDWFDIVAAASLPPPPASARLVEKLQASGVQITLRALHDQPFWSLPEITVAPSLIAHTTEAIVSRLGQHEH